MRELMQRHRIIFSHPKVDPLMVGKGKLLISDRGRLVVVTGPNQIRWSYGLNTTTYPTYGGEVTQILSAYVDDLTVGGDVSNYEMMEDIYLWFLTYMTVATQGGHGDDPRLRFDQEPVDMYYPIREWYFKIKPVALPGLRIARDLTAPTWSMTAAVVETTREVEGVTLAGAIEGLEEINAGIGYEEYNPFSAPTKRRKGFESVDKATDRLANVYTDIQDQFNEGDFKSISEQASWAPKMMTGSSEKDEDK